MTTVITVENLGKKYLLSHQSQKQPYVALRDVITERAVDFGRTLLHPFRSSPLTLHSSQEEFWALKDVSFEVKQGDRIGIIGRNGAGKSTLLKIFSRIVEPTTGRVRIKGRVASLLEVGTGFHPELTGRENIFLNGAILGMTRAEIKKKFDEIVDFAEIEKFLDTPVKRYSSGMYVRLAFAVAAHLEPEILLVDEVLAVGDAQFQKKCLGKMEDVSTREGRTVLFVSHNMGAIKSLCNDAILLTEGRLSCVKNVTEVLDMYHASARTFAETLPLGQRKDRIGSGKIIFESLNITDDMGIAVSTLESGRNYSFVIGYRNVCGDKLKDVVASLDFYDEDDVRVLMFRSNFTNSNFSIGADGGKIICQLDKMPLVNGRYRLSLFLSHADADILDFIEDAAEVKVYGGDFFGTGSGGSPTQCKILHMSKWHHKSMSVSST